MGGHNIYIPRIILTPQTQYGFFYNFWAATGYIANYGWHVPSVTEFRTLLDYLGASGDYLNNSVGGELKETGTTYWDSPNTGATNSSGFNGRGTGQRDDDTGLSGEIKKYCNIWSTTDYIVGSKYMLRLAYNNSKGSLQGNYPEAGNPVRLIKDSTTLSNGQIGSYIGNDGITYPTICIGTQEWLAANLEETKFRDGSSIPYIDNVDESDNTEWAAATSAAYCIYPTS